MTDRMKLDELTSDALDQLYYRLDRARDAVALHRQGLLTITELYEVIEAGSAPEPTATQAAEAEKTTRVFAALHRSAEQDVARVINLYERWVKAGPPPLGVSIARWWDQLLVELHDAIRPTGDQTKEDCTDSAHVGYATTGECVHGPAQS